MIVFQSNRDDDFDIYVMNADDQNQINISNNSYDDRWPSWR